MRIKKIFQLKCALSCLAFLWGTHTLLAKAKAPAKESPAELTFDPDTWVGPKIPKIPNKERKRICEIYKGRYISSIGNKVYFVQDNCKRRELSLQEAQSASKDPKATFKQVDSKIIAALPPLKKKAKYTTKEVYKELKGKCVTAGKVVYLVMDGGKRAFPDRITANKYCLKNEDDRIVQLQDYGKLAMLRDLPGIKSQAEPYREREMPVLKVQAPGVVCKRLKAGAIYSFHSKVFELIKSKEACYLQELDTYKRDIRMKLSDNPPIELDRSDVASIEQRPVKKDGPKQKKG